jgi:hypothetical protein
MGRKIALVTSRTLALYGFAAWVYIALVALVHPYTLGWQLTHFASFPHEDTFGETSFVVSLISFFVHNLLRATEQSAPTSPSSSLSAGDVPGAPGVVTVAGVAATSQRE